ncbi:hypothetical protein [Halarcobacter anaerophilus]|uniref:hypothetical protein n=1 Tax=Halarcobacter anaerophilus TaxID=877500 RepID=UPI0005C8E37D|nr:hypothetical protein [Halarcobacter anaerophilus]
MSRINPFYLITLFLLLFILSLFSLNKEKESLKNIENEKKELFKLSQEYKDYKNSWFDKKQIEQRVSRIIKSITFKDEKILTSQTKNIIKIKIESQNEKILEKFLKKVLNEKFIIKKLEVKKESMYFEIGIKI